MSDLVPDLDDIASRALASIILERTADTMHDNSELAAVALTSLAAETGLVLDVAAAILTATSWLAGTAGLSAEVIFAASVAFAPDEVPDDHPDAIDVTAIDTTADTTTCPHEGCRGNPLDHCPMCSRHIVDTDDNGLELGSGQRWCRDHAATCGITIEVP